MKLLMDIPDYSSTTGLRLKWEEYYVISAQIIDGSVVIKADQGGLISIARHLLTLAQESVPDEYHIHLDDTNVLEKGSCEIVLEKSH